jgi:hypothetical protein
VYVRARREEAWIQHHIFSSSRRFPYEHGPSLGVSVPHKIR